MRDPSLTVTTQGQGMSCLWTGAVFKQLQRTEEFAKVNEMQLNYKKTKLILFNPGSSMDFMPQVSLCGNELEVVNEIRLLGLVIRADMRWCSYTQNMVKKANKRLWILRRLKNMGANKQDLVDV